MLRLLECQIHPAVAKGVSSKVTLKAFTLGQQGPGVEGAEQLLPLMTQTREDFNKKVQPLFQEQICGTILFTVLEEHPDEVSLAGKLTN